MNARQSIAQSTAVGLRKFTSRRDQYPTMIGFDGFVDSIISVVDKRLDGNRFDPVRSIEQFARKIAAASGMSANYELVVTLQKLGGNGPIMANAMGTAGVPVDYIGAVGDRVVHPAFSELAKVATVHPVIRPGSTDALEFSDGKVMLGKYDFLNSFDWNYLLNAMGLEQITQVIRRSKLIAMLNWTMMSGQTDIWKHIIRILAQDARPESRHIFIDLSDPEKRTRPDLLQALKLCQQMQHHAQVTLGMNLKESTQVARALNVDVTDDPESAIESTARRVRDKLKLYTVVIHPRRSAAAARLVDGKVQSAHFNGPFVEKPKLSTGAGDNFNAGFCLGTLAELNIEQCLCAGTTASGYYVRNASSATLAQLADFCAQLPDPE